MVHKKSTGFVGFDWLIYLNLPHFGNLHSFICSVRESLGEWDFVIHGEAQLPQISQIIIHTTFSLFD